MLARVEDRSRLAHFAEYENIKSLRDEIALARMLVEKRYHLIKTDADLIASCAPLNKLMLTIEKLVKTCHTMGQSLGTLLARGTVLELGKRLCQIIVDELQGKPGYESTIDSLIEKLVPALTQNGETHVSEVQTEPH